jgi:hypothetical protein
MPSIRPARKAKKQSRGSVYSGITSYVPENIIHAT